MRSSFESKTVKYIPGLLVVASIACFGGCGDVLPNTVAGEQETGPDPSMLVVEPATIDLGEAGTSVPLQFTNTSQYDLSVETSTTYATGPKDWLTVTPATAQCPAGQEISFDFVADRDIVPAGQWDAEVTLMAGGIRKTVMVSIAVVAVAASVESHNFGTSSAPLQFQVWNAGGGTLQYQVDGAPSWLAVDGGSGTSTGPDDRKTVSLSVNRSGMPAGTYGGQIIIRPVIARAGFSQRIDVTMTVPPTLTIQASTTGGQAPLVVDFTAMDGTAPAANLPAGSTLNWDFGDDTPVAHGSQINHTFTSGGTFVVALSLTLAGGLGTVGCHQATVTVTQAAGQQGSLVVSPTGGLSASGLVGDTFTPGSKTYTLSNPGDTTIAWTAGTAAPPWVTLSKTGGTLAGGATDTVTVSINAAAASLAAGNYGGSMTFVNTTNHTGDTARSVALTVNAWPAQPGVLSVSPTTDLTASGQQGGPFNPSSVTYTLTNTGGSDINWTAGKTQDWVSLSKTSGTLSAGGSDTVTVSIATAANALAVGNYNDTATFTNGTNGNGNTTRVVSLTVTSGPQMASSISQYGITWTFDKAYQVGQFVNGDWWVMGPVTILSVTPAPTGNGSSYRNGSMINPVPRSSLNDGDGQSYDGRNGVFNASKAVSFPTTLTPTQSLVSTHSIATPSSYTDVTGYTVSSGNSYTQTASVLTCVSSPPAATAFRPAYCNATKTIYDSAGINWALLPSLSTPNNPPSVATLTSTFQRPWIDHCQNWIGRLMHPMDNMPNYGREISYWVGEAGCALCCDYLTLSQKKPITIGLIQLGIDYYSMANSTPNLFEVCAGQNIGRKFPILFAGLMLNDSGMLNHPATGWSEDDSTYYGADRGPTQTLWTGWVSQPKPYANVGSNNVLYRYMAGTDTAGNSWDYEQIAPSGWSTSPFPNNGNQYPFDKHEGYRRLVSYAWIGQAVSARILGLKTGWGHDAYFDYVDRWMNEDDTPNRTAIAAAASALGWNTLVPGADWTNPATYNPFGQSALSQFAKDMYVKYRSQY